METDTLASRFFLEQKIISIILYDSRVNSRLSLLEVELGRSIKQDLFSLSDKLKLITEDIDKKIITPSVVMGTEFFEKSRADKVLQSIQNPGVNFKEANQEIHDKPVPISHFISNIFKSS